MGTTLYRREADLPAARLRPGRSAQDRFRPLTPEECDRCIEQQEIQAALRYYRNRDRQQPVEPQSEMSALIEALRAQPAPVTRVEFGEGAIQSISADNVTVQEPAKPKRRRVEFDDGRVATIEEDPGEPGRQIVEFSDGHRASVAEEEPGVSGPPAVTKPKRARKVGTEGEGTSY
jgi:hypothetical protein